MSGEVAVDKNLLARAASYLRNYAKALDVGSQPGANTGGIANEIVELARYFEHVSFDELAARQILLRKR